MCVRGPAGTFGPARRPRPRCPCTAAPLFPSPPYHCAVHHPPTRARTRAGRVRCCWCPGLRERRVRGGGGRVVLGVPGGLLRPDAAAVAVHGDAVVREPRVAWVRRTAAPAARAYVGSDTGLLPHCWSGRCPPSCVRRPCTTPSFLEDPCSHSRSCAPACPLTESIAHAAWAQRACSLIGVGAAGCAARREGGAGRRRHTVAAGA